MSSDLIPPSFNLPQNQSNVITAPTIASASIIKPSAAICFVTGTAQLTTIEPPFAGNHELILIFTDASPGIFSTAGNIKTSITPIQNTSTILYYEARSGKYYPASYATGGGAGNPASPDTSVQFNNGGSFGGDADLTWNKTSNTLKLGASGVSLTPGTGTLAFLGLGGGANEQMAFDFDTIPDRVRITSSTGALIQYEMQFTDIDVTGTVSHAWGYFQVNPASAFAESVAVEGENYAVHTSGTTDFLTGVEGNTYTRGAGGNVTNQDGVGGYNERTATGTTALMSAIHAYAPTISAGTVTINAGVTIDDQAGSGAITDYSLYAPGTSPSLFGGVVQTGGYKSSDGSTGINTTVTTASLVGKTITIKNGLITGFA